ncbi:dihydrodipicolinate synthase family protein [Olivibacter sp. SDN3]|uniref:dihydrodipicolinate synthase family protein n=1 Tax=Olivibacter sp. SDN3 TaxID=2764720 RepID=UPI001651575F|nr:dihydrodipicolinate synthase family protein [Olivibacter sp. SDN3]QNL52244.1 dihydrodipicolinate synthase family protein [Olivibacter sp. SDN3]
MQEKPKGFVPVMLTPFTEVGLVDLRALTSLTEFYINAGATGLFANCQSSEMFELTESESLKVIAHVLKVANGKVPVVAACSIAGNVAMQADFVKRAHALGVQAVIIITGLLGGEEDSDEYLNSRIYQLFELTEDIPLGFYECPEPYKRLLKAHQLGRFVSTGRVIYHKDTCLDIEQVQAKIAATAKYSLFGLYDAYMGHAVASLRSGAAGLSCIQGNYFPELIVWLCQHFDQHHFTSEVNLVQQFLIENMEVMHAAYPIVSKYFLQKRGLSISLFSRREIEPFNNKAKLSIDKLYTDYTRLANYLELPKAIQSHKNIS